VTGGVCYFLNAKVGNLSPVHVLKKYTNLKRSNNFMIWDEESARIIN
jgi:hypothetical protein